MPDSARAIIHAPYKSLKDGTTRNSIILVKDLIDPQRRFALPGGQFDGTKDKSWEDTVKREVREELGLDAFGTRFVGSIPAARGGNHHLFVVEARGIVDLDHEAKKRGLPREVDNLGFYGAGRHNMLPEGAQQGHLLALRGLYKWNPYWDPNIPKPDIQIPPGYLDRWRGIMDEIRQNDGKLPRDGYGGWRV